MKKSTRVLTLVIAIGAVATGFSAKSDMAKATFMLNGYYFEGCSCPGPCPCTLTGPVMSCEGVGLYVIKHGSFKGKDISGVKAAYGVGVGKWVKIYVDGPASKRAAAMAFMRAGLAAFGKIESARAAKITITGSKGKYVGLVDGGKVMKLTTVPVMGLDKKNPLTYMNTIDPLSPTVMQGKTIGGTYSDGGHSFTLKDSNAYFNTHINSHGKL